MDMLGYQWIVEKKVNLKSHPGVPWCDYGATNGAVLEAFPELVKDAVRERLSLLLAFPLSELQAMSPQQLVEAGLCDPIRCFIKAEPHKQSKLEEGRLRIIAGVSLVDNIIERILYRKQNEKEILNWKSIPFNPGMGLHDEGLVEIHRKMDRFESKCESDISAWDWSVPAWLMEDAKDYRLLVAGLGKDTCFARLVEARYQCHQKKVFYVGGKLFAQERPGIVPSGSYLTSSDNSHMRYMTSIIVQLMGGREDPDAEVMGDDGVELPVPDGQALYSSLGLLCKQYLLRPKGDYEFCSTYWPPGSELGWPVSWARTLYRYLSHPRGSPDREQWRHQLGMDLRNLPSGAELVARISKWEDDSVVDEESKFIN